MKVSILALNVKIVTTLEINELPEKNSSGGGGVEHP